MTIDELRHLRESEDKVEFKEAKKNFPFAGGSHSNPHDRWKCVLGYCVALANEGGGLLVFGMTDKVPHQVVGTDFSLHQIGALEDEIYTRLGMRVRVEELFETDTNLRVLVFDIPGRPTRRVMRFEGVPLMRTGESLRLMSEDELQRIYSEQESDFSIKPCKAFTLEDIDERAVTLLKQGYSNTQQNESFSQLPDEQILSDLGLLLSDGTLTNAALVLLGKPEALERLLPQARIMIEYRLNEGQIHFDKREVIREPIFLAIETAWNFIDAYNGESPVRVNARIIRVPFFDKKVIREALLNAIAHRNYAMNGRSLLSFILKKRSF